MTIITELADGRTEVFDSTNYVISKPKDFHPLICRVSVYVDNKRIKTVSRRFVFFYKHFKFKTEKVQTLLRDLEKQRELAEQANKT